LIFDELLEAPKAWRRRLLLALPTMVGRIGGLLNAIRAISPQRAAQLLQPEAAEFWGALAAPGKLPWRLIALVHVQLAVGIAILIGSIGSLSGLDPLAMAGMVLAILLEASAVWFVLKGLGIARYRLAVRRAKKLAAGKQPRDSLLTTNYVFCAVAVAASLVQLLSGKETGGLAIAGSCAALVVLMLVLSGRGRRWEMLLLAGLGIAATWRTLAVLLGAWMPEPAIVAISCSLGALLAVLADEWHARRDKLDPPRARANINHIALKLAAACFVVLLLGLKFGVAKEDTNSSMALAERQELEARKAQSEKVQARIQQAIAKMRQEGNPSQQWAHDNGVTELPKFHDVDEAFQTLRQALTPREVFDTPYRAFHVPDGPLAGDWIFSGGDHSRPDRMVHYPLADASGVRKVGQMLCRKSNSACRDFQREAATVPEELSRDDRQAAGARLTWDSPGRSAKDFDCPATELQPNEFSLLPSIPVRVLFNGGGGVVEVQLRGSSGNANVDSAVLSAAQRLPDRRERFRTRHP
jgi:hypothetical protein